ncbi:PEP/pyruvate-binding domain-containing protein [Frigidibacter sp. SD6-1]|uniref:PEP/pyruvate-binding domain-containing protein n=1 Tax=Frigidibacter sp. SD6-1 TaxID=3032581 RepID=UPI0024DFD7E0|nr:PEP/pyruvate-binding domain-containing protein [Frigidibacter sp. SD6-1]
MVEPLGMSFTDCAALDRDDQTRLFGGKGAGLARMVQLGLPVPPGFTLSTKACRSYLAAGWTPSLESALSDCLAALETETGKKLGDPLRPLLLSVRSGAAISMPGMMDTVLNVGMTDEIAQRLGEASGDPRFGWDSLRRFIQAYVSVVGGAPADRVRAISGECLGADDGAGLAPDQLARATAALRTALDAAGHGVPADPLDQVRNAVGAVFASWAGDRARTYRRLEGIADDLYTAATVQMMAFGNLGDRSGTGVAFSRDPSSGAPRLVGDFLKGAQGEDVVAGTHRTLPISALRRLWPDVADQMEHTAHLLERDLRHLADIEFTVENGRFWMLQCRRGKHSPRAALRMAIDMAEDAGFPLTRDEALDRVRDILNDPPMLPCDDAGSGEAEVLVTGLAASPGRAIGALCTSVDAAVAAEGRGEAVILVRRETSPADIAGMAASRGILTTLGGHVSHAAVVARGWGLPAVVGAEGVEVLEDGIRIGDRMVPTGSEITLDGTSGQVLLGAHNTAEVEAPEVAVLRAWQRGSGTGIAALPAGQFAEDATRETVSRALALKGMGDAAAIASVLGAEVDAVETVLDELKALGDVTEMPRGRVRPTPDLAQRMDDAFAAAADRIKERIEPEMAAFHKLNDLFKGLITDWQMRMIGGVLALNDHSDPSHDAGVIGRIAGEVHEGIAPVIRNIAAAEPRLIRYLCRLDAALSEMRRGNQDMVAHPLKDSYHTVWFELHEELIRLTGRKRTE